LASGTKVKSPERVSEETLWERYKRYGDEQARELLLVQNLDLVKYLAGRMAIHVPSTVAEDDLIGWGVLGLLDAVDKYDPSQKIKFRTYASFRVKGSMLDEIRSLDWAPRSLRHRMREVEAAASDLRREFGREPSQEQVARRADITIEQLSKILAQAKEASLVSLDEAHRTEDGDEYRTGDLAADSGVSSPFDTVVKAEVVEKMSSAIADLPESQRKVIHLYYYEELTLKEIGAVLGVSESRICQIHKEAVKSLKQVMV